MTLVAIIGGGFEYFGVRKDGAMIWLETSLITSPRPATRIRPCSEEVYTWT